MLARIPIGAARMAAAMAMMAMMAAMAATAGMAATAVTAVTAVTGRGGRSEPVRILALGDSYTIGEAVTESERWPVQLAGLLRERGREVAEPEIVATTGWTTDELAAGIEAAELSPPYELVTLLIGVNNQYRGRPLDEYREQFGGLLERAVDFAGGDPDRVLVLSIPDYGVTPFAVDRDPARIGREIDRFNDAAREITAEAGSRWLDVTAYSRQAADDPSLVAADGLHPSGKMYAGWARMALPEAEAALEGPEH